MPILPRYFLKVFIPIFLACLAMFLGVLLMNHFIKIFNMAVMRGISPLWIAACFARLLPFISSLAVPMAFLVSMLLTLGQLSESGEVMALRASGFSFAEMTWPFFGIGLILSGFLLYLNHKASPEGFHSFRNQYARVFEGDDTWKGLEVPGGSRFAWAPKSTYIQEPPFFQNLPVEPPPLRDIRQARVLAVLGDSVTTDHISPAGAIPKNGPAASYLKEHGVEQPDWNTFGSRRGSHEVMMRGTFGNVRIKNALVPEKEGNWTLHFPTGEVISIYDAAMRYIAEGTPLVLLVGKEYGTGSSRDWAAKGTTLLGVKAVIAESYERIHRSNLVGMGVLPLAYEAGITRQTLGLTGRETIAIDGIASGLTPGGTVQVHARADDGKATDFRAVVRLNSPVELDYLRHGGILPRVLRMFLKGEA